MGKSRERSLCHKGKMFADSLHHDFLTNSCCVHSAGLASCEFGFGCRHCRGVSAVHRCWLQCHEARQCAANQSERVEGELHYFRLRCNSLSSVTPLFYSPVHLQPDADHFVQLHVCWSWCSGIPQWLQCCLQPLQLHKSFYGQPPLAVLCLQSVRLSWHCIHHSGQKVETAFCVTRVPPHDHFPHLLA